MGTPAPAIPASIGMVEQEQNGVMKPRTMAANLPANPVLPPNTWRILSGETYSRIRPESQVMKKNRGISSARMVKKNLPAVMSEAFIWWL